MTIMIPVEKMRKFVDLLSSVTDETVFNASPEGITASALDKSNVAMVQTTLKPVAFGSLPDEPVQFAIDLGKLNKALRLARSGDTIMLTPSEDDIQINVGSSLTMKIRLLVADRMRVPKQIPNITYTSAFTIDASELSRIVRASDGVAHAMTFAVNHKGCRMFAEGDTDSVELLWDAENIDFLEAGGEYASTVGLEYISAVAKVLSGDDEVSIELTQDHPVTIKLETEDIDAKYILAPRIDQD